MNNHKFSKEDLRLMAIGAICLADTCMVNNDHLGALKQVEAAAKHLMTLIEKEAKKVKND